MSPLFDLAAEKLNKLAITPTEQIAPPTDPAAAGGAPPVPGGMPPMPPGAAMPPMSPPGGMPMDPAMAGGMPMDPAMAGGMPMDPAMAGGPMPEGEDPLEMLIERLDTITEMMVRVDKRSDQTAKLIAAIADQLQINIPLAEMVDAGDPPPSVAKKSSIEVPPEQDGYAADIPPDGQLFQYETPQRKLSAAVQVASKMFG